MLDLLAILLILNGPDPFSWAQDYRVLESMVYRDEWVRAEFVLHDSQNNYFDRLAEVPFRWNLPLASPSEDGVAIAQTYLDQAWAAMDRQDPLAQQIILMPARPILRGATQIISALDPDRDRVFDLIAEFRNGREIVRVPVVELNGDTVTLRFPEHDTALRVSLDQSAAFHGGWDLSSGSDGIGSVPFTTGSFMSMMWCPTNGSPISDAIKTQLEGEWTILFSESGRAMASFEIIQSVREQENAQLIGTFEMFTGETCTIAGRVLGNEHRDDEGPQMRLSRFDGKHAYHLRGELQPDGSIKGDFCSETGRMETWVAVPAVELAD
ncbi:MAG: hypothetical protein R3B67_10075 [Phycisphaerales bacterium]